MSTQYDAVVIGAGQAGPPLAVRLGNAGRKTAIIERQQFGGTCVNVGCIPTKTLVASARAIHMARRGNEFGFTVGSDVRADMTRIKARKDDIVRRSREGIEKWLRETPNVTVLQGHARFTGPHTLSVNGESIEAGQIFINVGARAILPDRVDATNSRCLTNSTILDLDELPEHLIIIGGSYIGLEFAQVFRRFGSRVTVVERSDRLIAREDEDVSRGLQEVLEAEGIGFRLNATCIDVQTDANSAIATVDCTKGAPRIVGSHVLFAVGRKPNTGDLGLEEAGIKTDARGYIQVDSQGRTSAEGVWAIGECNGHGAFTHTSYNDYEVVAANVLDGDPRQITDRIPCYALYTDPPVGRAGMTMAEAKGSGRPLLIGMRPMKYVGRAREMSETSGFMRTIVDAETKRILGAVVFGINGDEVVHSILDVMYAGAPVSTVTRAVHIHPTITELIPTMLQELTPG
jgi:pyruvate/2-oxoglutarate dehydrogenase complex dihydrolipoamide dehydrogenase (E3) component